MSNACGLVWVTLVDQTFEQKSIYNDNVMTVGLYLAEVFHLKNAIWKIIFSWTDCKSKLYQECKIKNACVVLTLTKLG